MVGFGFPGFGQSIFRLLVFVNFFVGVLGGGVYLLKTKDSN